MNLRGQEVSLDIDKKQLSITIHKPLGNTFSLSDKLVSFLNKGYAICVTLPEGKKQIVESEKEVFRRETVKSKFVNAKDWYRYWFKIKTDQGQKELF